MIRIEVTSEADVTRMVAAFQVLEALQDSDYEIWRAGCARRAWRKDGQRGGTGTISAAAVLTDRASLSGTGTISAEAEASEP